MAPHGTPEYEDPAHHDAVPEQHPSTAIPGPRPEPGTPSPASPPSHGAEPRTDPQAPFDTPDIHVGLPAPRPPHPRRTEGHHLAPPASPAARQHPVPSDHPPAPARPGRALRVLRWLMALLIAVALACVCLAVHQMMRDSLFANTYVGLAGVAAAGVGACAPAYVHLLRRRDAPHAPGAPDTPGAPDRPDKGA
ncbi:hypothetical protein [Streptomyces sp. NBC_00582]|uniref:hypothetical protein n=1 Tax=Streptomyces sp. NBC_00582 TaxID=2975783 RepID=UPI0010631777|nr:hypothetical protein [Streptomyces sp. NBC_00582]WUB60662.1 hypothetical protein OG852_09830 [Streptomyces sp. NBC_00582]